MDFEDIPKECDLEPLTNLLTDSICNGNDMQENEKVVESSSDCVSLTNGFVSVQPLPKEEPSTLQKKVFIKTTKITAPKLLQNSPTGSDQIKNLPSLEKSRFNNFTNLNSTKQNSPTVFPLNNLLADKTENILNGLKEGNAVQERMEVPKTSTIYQGLLADTASGSTKEQTKRKLKTIKRKDLENIIIEQFYSQVFHEHELGYQKNLCKKLEETLELTNKKALKLSSEIKDLQGITAKLEAEHKMRKERFILPSQVKRSVGIQCFVDIKNGCTDPYSLLKSPPYKRKKLVNSEGRSRMKSADKLNCRKKKSFKNHFSDKEIPGDYLLENLFNEDSSNLYNGQLKDRGSNDQNNHRFLRPPPPPDVPGIFNSSLRPSTPILRARREQKSITLSWDLEQGQNCDRISYYQLYLCEIKESDQRPSSWRNAGDVKALELPMKCTLVDFKSGSHYYFAVRAIDSRSKKRGPFSKPKRIFMP